MKIGNPSKNILCLLLNVGFVAVSSFSFCQKDQKLGDKLDRLVSEQVQKLNVPGYAITVIYKGETILQKGYGYSDIASEKKPDAETVFGLASLTKSFTGLALVQLIEAKKVNLDDQLGQYLDGLSPKYQKLTIKQLATMSAGVPRIVKPDDISWKDQIKKAQTEPLVNTPGTTFLYSNLGYRIIGAVIEKVSGKSYMEYLQENILRPLDMKQTGRTDKSFTQPIATAYVVNDKGKDKPVDYKAADITFSSGMLASNLTDLSKYTQALLKHDPRLLSPKGYDLLWKQRWNLSNGDKNSWAFGWDSKQKQGHWLITWNGGDPGVASLIEIYSDDQLIVIALANAHDKAYSIGHKVSSTVLGLNNKDDDKDSEDGEQ